MSLAETQQIMQVCQEIIKLLDGIEFKTEKLVTEAPRTERIFENFRQLERVAVRYLAIARQLGLPEDAEKTVQLLARIIVMMRMVQASMTMMTGGPIGVAMGVASMLLAGLSAGSMLEGY